MGVRDDGPFPVSLWRERIAHIRKYTLSLFLLHSLPNLEKKKKGGGVEQFFVFNHTVLFGVKLNLVLLLFVLKVGRLSEVLFWQPWGLKPYIQKVNRLLKTDAIAELFVLSHWPTFHRSKGVTAFTSGVNQYLNFSACCLVSFVTFRQHPKYTRCFPNKDPTF